MVKRGKKSAILQQLYKQGYDPKTAQNYIESAEGQTKYPNLKISRSKYYVEYKKHQKGTLTTATGEGKEALEGSTEGVKPSPSQTLQIEVGGEPTPLTQLDIIHADGAPAIGADGQVIPQLMTGDQLSGLFKAAKENYPEKYRWSNQADGLLGAVWSPIYNKWIAASNENFLLGFAIICTLLIIVRPTILTVIDWNTERKERRETLSPLEKRAEKALKKN